MHFWFKHNVNDYIVIDNDMHEIELENLYAITEKMLVKNENRAVGWYSLNILSTTNLSSRAFWSDLFSAFKDRPFMLTSRHGLRLDITVRKRSGQMWWFFGNVIYNPK